MTPEQIAQLEIIIQANADQFRKELLDVNKKLAGMEKSTKESAETMRKQLVPSIVVSQLAVEGIKKGFQAFTSVLRKFTGFLVNTIKKIVDGGSKFARLSIATETVTKNMGIASEEVDALRDSLADANTYGVVAEQVIRSLALSGLFELSKQLKTVDARTGETMEGVSALTLTMKDLAASAGIESAEGIKRLTDFIVRGQTGLIDGIVQVGNLGTEYKDFAKTLGKTRMQLTAGEEAQARLNMIMREGEKAFGAYANTYTTSGKMIGSISEAMRANYEILGGALESVFASVSSVVLTFVNNVRRFLLGNLDTIREWAIKVSAWVIYVIRGLGALLSRIPLIGGYMENLANFEFPKVTVAAENTAEAIKNVGSGMDGASDSAKALKKELMGLAGFDEMNVLNPPEPTAGGGVGGLNMGGIGGLGSDDMDLGGLFDLDDISGEITDKVKQLEKEFGRFDKRIQDILDKPLIKWLWENKELIAKMVVIVTLLTIALGLVIEAVTIWTTAFGGLKTVALAVAGLIGSLVTGFLAIPGAGWIVVAIIAQIALMVWQLKYSFEQFEKHFPNWREGMKDIADGTKNFMNKVIDLIFPMRRVKDAKNDSEEASKTLLTAEEELIDVTERLKGANEDLVGAELDTLRQKERVQQAEEKLTELREAGKEGTDEYRIAELELIQENTRLEDSNEKLTEIQQEVNDLNDESKKKINAVEDAKNEDAEATKRLQDEMDKVNSKNMETVADKIKRKWGEMKKDIEYNIELLEWFVNDRFEKIGQGISDSFGKVVSRLKWLVNTFVIKPLNDARLIVNQIPGVNIQRIPYLAEGGIIESPTVAMLGEAGKEAVIPLENNTGWMDDLADKIGGGSGTINLTVQVGDEKIAEKVIDLANDKATRTGNLVFNV